MAEDFIKVNIDDLPVAEMPLGGNDRLEILQGGVNRQVKAEELSSVQAGIYAGQAEQARDDAIAAASASGDFVFAKDLADMQSKLPLPDGTVIEVAVDSDHDGCRTRYLIESSAPVFVLNLDVLSVKLREPDGAKNIGFDSRNLYSKVRDFRTPLDFPGVISDASSETTESLQEFLNSSANDGAVVYSTANQRYLVEKLVIPTNIRMEGVWNIVAIDSPFSGYRVELGGGAFVEDLRISLSGNNQGDYWLKTNGQLSNVSSLHIENRSINSQNTSTGVLISHSNVTIGYFSSLYSQRPLGIVGNTTTGEYLENITIGNVDIYGYTRGVYCAVAKSLRIGRIRARGRNPSAVLMQAGSNGVLLDRVFDAQFGDIYVEDSAEHAVRISGTQVARTGLVNIDSITAVRPRGAAFKINPSSGYVEDVYIGSISGEDVGEGQAITNQEVCRISHAKNIVIPTIESHTTIHDKSGAQSLALNDVDGLVIDSITADKNSTVPIIFRSEQDGYSGDVFNIHIGTVIHKGLCAAIANFSMLTADYGNIFFYHVYASNVSQGVLYFNSGTRNPSKLVYANAYIESGVSSVYSPPDENLITDVQFGYRRNLNFSGGANTTASQFSMKVNPLDLSSVGDGFLVGSLSSTSDVGAAVQLSSIRSTRRGAAMAVKQRGSGARDLSLAFYVPVTASNSDGLVESFLINKNGTLTASRMPSYSGDSAAIAAGLASGDIYKTPSGELRIVV